MTAEVGEAQNMLKSLSKTAAESARFSAHSNAATAVSHGVSSVFSGRAFGKKKDTSKGTDEALVSYLNPQVGFKGQYPKSYTRSEEDGQVSFSSADNGISIIYFGEPESTLDEQFQKVNDELGASYELLDQEKNDDDFTVKYNTGGTYVTIHGIAKDTRVAMVMIAYPEDQATDYKKLINNIQKSLQFFK